MNANKRTPTLQDVGGSITALSPVQFEGRFITGMANIARETSDVNQPTSVGTTLLPVCSAGPQVATCVAEANVAQHIDDVFQSQPSLPKAAPVDLQRVERLRGPQRAQFFRNATGSEILIGRAIGRLRVPEFEVGKGDFAPIHDCAPAYRRGRTSAPHAFDRRIAGKAEVIPS